MHPHAYTRIHTHAVAFVLFRFLLFFSFLELFPAVTLPGSHMWPPALSSTIPSSHLDCRPVRSRVHHDWYWWIPLPGRGWISSFHRMHMQQEVRLHLAMSLLYVRVFLGVCLYTVRNLATHLHWLLSSPGLSLSLSSLVLFLHPQ